MSEADFETLAVRLAGACVVMFALLGLAAFHGPLWGYLVAMWAGGMVIPVYRWYADLIVETLL